MPDIIAARRQIGARRHGRINRRLILGNRRRVSLAPAMAAIGLRRFATRHSSNPRWPPRNPHLVRAECQACHKFHAGLREIQATFQAGENLGLSSPAAQGCAAFCSRDSTTLFMKCPRQESNLRPTV